MEHCAVFEVSFNQVTLLCHEGVEKASWEELGACTAGLKSAFLSEGRRHLDPGQGLEWSHLEAFVAEVGPLL